MTTEAPPMATLGEMIVEKLKASPQPLKLAEVVKALPKPPKGVKPAAYREQITATLEEGLRSGRLFAAPSGKGGEARYWGRDERYLLRERGLQLADKPQELAKLRAKLAREVKGADAAYVEGQLRDLIGDGYLHQHEGKKGPLFASLPPTPLLERPANAKELAKLVVSVEKLMKKAGVDAESVLLAVRRQLGAERPAQVPAAAPPVTSEAPAAPVIDAPPAVLGPSDAEVERHVLDAVDREGTMSLKELRRRMPAGGRGPLFDRVVLGLEDRGQVILSRDVDASHFAPEEQAEYVREGEVLFTSIAKRG